MAIKPRRETGFFFAFLNNELRAEQFKNHP